MGEATAGDSESGISPNMNRYSITALEDVDVSVSDEHTAIILVRGVPRPVVTRGTPHWKHLTKGEVCEVVAVQGIRGDFFEECDPIPLSGPAVPLKVHDALKIEELTSEDASPRKRPLLDSITPSHR